VNLRTRWVQVFDHRADGQLLYFKERLAAPDHPRRAEMEKFTVKVRKLGIATDPARGLTAEELKQLLERLGLNSNLNRRRLSGKGEPTRLKLLESLP